MRNNKLKTDFKFSSNNHATWIVKILLSPPQMSLSCQEQVLALPVGEKGERTAWAKAIVLAKFAVLEWNIVSRCNLSYYETLDVSLFPVYEEIKKPCSFHYAILSYSLVVFFVCILQGEHNVYRPYKNVI